MVTPTTLMIKEKVQHLCKGTRNRKQAPKMMLQLLISSITRNCWINHSDFVLSLVFPQPIMIHSIENRTIITAEVSKSVPASLATVASLKALEVNL